MKFFVIKSYSDIDLSPTIELRYGYAIISRLIAEYDSFSRAAKVAKKLNARARVI